MNCDLFGIVEVEALVDLLQAGRHRLATENKLGKRCGGHQPFRVIVEEARRHVLRSKRHCRQIQPGPLLGDRACLFGTCPLSDHEGPKHNEDR
jgi:hypothetical protein